MNARALLASSGLLLALQAPGALACGYCVEDKVAAAYDHAVVTRALARKHHVAFFHLEGALAPGAATKRALEALAESAPGVDHGSARVSVETSTLAVAFDPGRFRIGALQGALERKLAAQKLSLLPLRLIDQSAELKVMNPK